MPINIIEFNNKKYKYESLWRKSAHDSSTDAEGKLLPFPEKGSEWQNRTNFLSKLKDTQQHLKFHKYKPSNYTNCLLCRKKNINTGFYQLNKIRWESGIEHYVDIHKIKPSEIFIDLIFRHQVDPHVVSISRAKKLKGVTVVKKISRLIEIRF
jgi:hypothetical protein